MEGHNNIVDDKDFVDLARKYYEEAANNVINAFNEGYFLGKRHAEKLFKEQQHEQN